MIFRQFIDYESNTYTYLISSGIGREAIIIDPVKEQVPRYLKLLDELQLKLIITIDTHTHADHITGTGTLHQQLNCAILMGEQTQAECVTIKAKENDTINIDGLTLTCVYTPGHTDDSYSYVMKDRVFTGDTLLIRGTGRTDFQSGDPYQQYDSIFNKLLRLPEDTLVYPAHDYKGMTSSTIGEEKKTNPRLQVNSPDEYANIMNNLHLDKPKKFDVAVPANLLCGLTTLEQIDGR